MLKIPPPLLNYWQFFSTWFGIFLTPPGIESICGNLEDSSGPSARRLPTFAASRLFTRWHLPAHFALPAATTEDFNLRALRTRPRRFCAAGSNHRKAFAIQLASIDL